MEPFREQQIECPVVITDVRSHSLLQAGEANDLLRASRTSFRACLDPTLFLLIGNSVNKFI